MPRLAQRAFAGVVFAAAAVAVVAPSPRRAESAEDLEYRVKAEFVERFTRFIDWPSQAFAGGDAPFVLCVVGETPLLPYLEQLARERRIKERRVELRRLKPSADLMGCHLLFIAPSERPHLRHILDRLSGLPIVTVGDTEGFGREGVLINLVLDADGRVRFEISSSVAKKTTVKLDAQLLRLARLVSEAE
jgi:hypothetical protein